MKKLLMLTLSLALISCSGNKGEHDNPKQMSDNYDFSAVAISSKLEPQGRGAAKGKYPARIITARVVTVYKGEDLQAGQTVMIKMNNKYDDCNQGGTCRFTATVRHPAVKHKVYLLRGRIAGKY